MADIVERLKVYASDDHERLCEGRYYSCSCGYDAKSGPLLEEAAAEITALRGEVERLKVERDEQVQWVKDLADDLIKAEAEVERLRAALKKILNVPGNWGSEVYEIEETARAALKEEIE